MERRNEPPWRTPASRRSPPPPRSSIPAKRGADTQDAAWMVDEDRFVLQQAKKKAAVRVRGGRARPIDWLVVTLGVIDPTPNIDDDDDEPDIDVVDPEGVFEGLEEPQLRELEKDIETYITLETKKDNRDFWNTMMVICKDRLQQFSKSAPGARGVSSVTGDVDRLLAPKSFEQLEVLEKQIRNKLDSNEDIDVDYWEHLLRSLTVYKAKAKLRRVSQAIIDKRLGALWQQAQQEANAVREKLQAVLKRGTTESAQSDDAIAAPTAKLAVPSSLDPQPLLKLRPEDKGLELQDEGTFKSKIMDERKRILKLGYVPMGQRNVEKPSAALSSKTASGSQAFATSGSDDFSQAAKGLYEREVARGVNENEEIFAGEEEVATANKGQWADKYRPRKPRYFNRVQMGYEWNKYNQTHYDHDNPPPKVVQGYKFNIFYPDLIDKSKAPTYKIEREHGRKRGESFAPAGEEDTCLIRFIAGPPYEDIAFRIVDKEWDYSAKRDRGFKSSFDKGILQLHFQFKKIYYRK